MMEFSPDQLGLGGFITRFGRLGLSFQPPGRRAREAVPEAIATWKKEEYPSIRARARAEGAQAMFTDQAGTRSDHLPGGTWGATGVTPVGARSGHRFPLNAMSAISTRGNMSLSLFPGRFNAPTCIAFFEKLIGHAPGEKIHLILNRHAAHRSKDVTTWVADHAEVIELHFLPAYTPHLNPDELDNADHKRQLTDRTITNRTELNAQARP